jgi:UDP-glucose 4-epimerase
MEFHGPSGTDVALRDAAGVTAGLASIVAGPEARLKAAVPIRGDDMIVVLGGAGFLGRHLRDRLVAARRPFVLVSPRFPATLPEPVVFEQRITAQEFEHQAGDDLLQSASAVVNLISRSVPGTFATQPWREMPENVGPAAALFARCAALNPAAKLVHLSSGGTVYGRIQPPRADETTPCEPISGYGLGKLMIEEALRFTGRTAGLHYAILRVSNPVGLHQTSNDQGVVSIALRSALHGQPFRLLGDGSQIRDYLDADDVADAILTCIDDDRHTDGLWNVGSGIGRSVRDVLDLVERQTGRRMRIEQLPARPVDVPRIVLDCSKIERDLGWRTRRGLDGVVGRMFTRMQRQLVV